MLAGEQERAIALQQRRVVRRPRLLCARAEGVTRNQPRDDRLQQVRLRRREVLERFAGRRGWFCLDRRTRIEFRR